MKKINVLKIICLVMSLVMLSTLASFATVNEFKEIECPGDELCKHEHEKEANGLTALFRLEDYPDFETIEELEKYLNDNGLHDIEIVNDSFLLHTSSKSTCILGRYLGEMLMQMTHFRYPDGTAIDIFRIYNLYKCDNSTHSGCTIRQDTGNMTSYACAGGCWMA